MLLLRGILAVICMLFCGFATADEIDQGELMVEGTNERETERSHPREKDDYTDSFLQEPTPEPPLMIEGTNEEGDDTCFDDQDVDDEDE